MLTAPLPPELERAIDELAGAGRSQARVSAALTARYRGESAGLGPVARTRDEVLAYAVARLPATYAAVRVALGELAERATTFAPESQLDVGAGPGAALWAAIELWPSLRRLTAIEAAPEMSRLARELARAAAESALEDARWVEGVAPAAVPEESFDLVTASYVLGELPEERRAEAVDGLWAAAAGAVVIVEPGTPAGYLRVIAARDRLIELGGTVVAPCPHDRRCPLLGSGDWCHFAVRVARTGTHRRAKEASLGHEDEKFAYLVVARAPWPRAAARILRHPQIRSGHVLLDLCTDDGLRREIVSKRDRDRFRRARKSSWGDDFGR